MGDNNAMSNYFIAKEIFSNLGLIYISNHFQGSYWKIEDITVEKFSMGDNNAMSNYFIAKEIFSNLGLIHLSNHFQGSYWKLD